MQTFEAAVKDVVEDVGKFNAFFQKDAKEWLKDDHFIALVQTLAEETAIRIAEGENNIVANCAMLHVAMAFGFLINQRMQADVLPNT